MDKSTEVFAKRFEGFAENLESFDKHFESSAKVVERPPQRVSEYQIGEAIYHVWLHGLLASAPAIHKAVELVVNNPPSAETKEAQPYLARRMRRAPRSQNAMTMQGIFNTTCGLLWSAEECAGVAQICRHLAEVVLAPPEEGCSEAERKKKEATLNGKPFVPVDLQRRILEALDGKAMKKQELANAVCGGEGTRLYKAGGLKELRKTEPKLVDHKNGLGYFRPDRPPNQ